MDEWHRIMRKVMISGTKRDDRTGTGTRALFGEQLVFDNRVGFPAVTTKKLALSQVASELSCFLVGADSLDAFHAKGCTIWDGNGNASYWKPRWPGDLGRIYGVQWRDWTTLGLGGQMVSTDQLRQLVDGMKSQPHGRRHIVTAWNPGELDQMCLPPCHVLFQAYVVDGRVDLRVDMRSVDLFLGLPFDVASYGILQRLLAKELELNSGFLTFQLGDAHIYLNHMDQVTTVLGRVPLDPPDLRLEPETGLFNFEAKHASLLRYNHLGIVAAPMSV